MRKLNCWEFKKCGRGPSEARAGQVLCPAASMAALNGVHGGMQGGRSCWIVEGTLCSGKKSRPFKERFHSCSYCDFYRMVMQEEGAAFVLSSVLRSRVEIRTDAEQDKYSMRIAA